MGGEVTGETSHTELLSGFENESNVKGSYKATITSASFVFVFFARDLQREMGMT